MKCEQKGHVSLPAGSLSERVCPFTSSLLPVVGNGDTLGHGGFIGFGPGVRMAWTRACPQLDMQHEVIRSFCSFWATVIFRVVCCVAV